jgi:hypothetical protein
MSEPHTTHYSHSTPQQVVDYLLDKKDELGISDTYIQKRQDNVHYREFEDALWVAPRKIFDMLMTDRMNTEKFNFDQTSHQTGNHTFEHGPSR